MEERVREINELTRANLKHAFWARVYAKEGSSEALRAYDEKILEYGKDAQLIAYLGQMGGQLWASNLLAELKGGQPGAIEELRGRFMANLGGVKYDMEGLSVTTYGALVASEDEEVRRRAYIDYNGKPMENEEILRDVVRAYGEWRSPCYFDEGRIGAFLAHYSAKYRALIEADGGRPRRPYDYKQGANWGAETWPRVAKLGQIVEAIGAFFGLDVGPCDMISELDGGLSEGALCFRVGQEARFIVVDIGAAKGKYPHPSSWLYRDDREAKVAIMTACFGDTLRANQVETLAHELGHCVNMVMTPFDYVGPWANPIFFPKDMGELPAILLGKIICSSMGIKCGPDNVFIGRQLGIANYDWGLNVDTVGALDAHIAAITGWELIPEVKTHLRFVPIFSYFKAYYTYPLSEIMANELLAKCAHDEAPIRTLRAYILDSNGANFEALIGLCEIAAHW